MPAEKATLEFGRWHLRGIPVSAQKTRETIKPRLGRFLLGERTSMAFGLQTMSVLDLAESMFAFYSCPETLTEVGLSGGKLINLVEDISLSLFLFFSVPPPHLYLFVVILFPL